MAKERATRAERARELVPELVEREVEGVVLSYVDTSGIARVKTVPVSGLERAASWGVGMSPVFATFTTDDVPLRAAHLGGPDGDLRLLPDLDRLVPLAAQPGWAWAPVDRYTQDGEPHEGCARLVAAAAVERARRAGLTFQMAFEVEWAISRGEGDDFVPACVGPAYGFTRLTELSDYARDLLAAFRAEGIQVNQLHPEYSDSQFEVSVAASDPVGAADDNVLVRQTIRAVSARHGFRVSFAPAVLAGHVGNGGHVHTSVWRDGRNLFAGGDGRYGMTPEGEAVLAGVLDALPALQAVGAPTVASYLRLQPSHWAGVFRCWGRETRESAVRLVTGSLGERESAANFEVKCFDLAANPYLVVASLIGVALAGAEDAMPLAEEIVGDPAWLDADELRSRGIERLPQQLGDSLRAFAANKVLREVLGVPLHDAILTVRRAEIDRFDGASPDDIAAALRWIH